ncbi:5-aminopentanamidase [Arboricoccus pini]|uniref:5-aminopentanamidase n=1 Tax=Arboricoccus pini TaxID=1963835 RepID=A0A212RL93_9PROT|nr:carbon-nitrogen hydrolase family protein [Arboricoccus pini]SNB73248.1 5-aminopentanamidase [Arboricoccus pini]
MSDPAPRRLRLALHQRPLGMLPPVAFLTALRAQAQQAARLGADLLMLPEMVVSGYNIGAEAIERAAFPVDGELMAEVATIARTANLGLLLGYPERAADGIYSTAVLIDRAGQIRLNYRKQHLFGDVDRAVFAAGDKPSIALLDGIKVGLLICYDVEFPEAVRALALAGAELILVPTALMRPFEIVPRAMISCRAYENGVFMAYCNCTGAEGDFVYLGESCIVGPDGRFLAKADALPTMIMAELEIDAAIARARSVSPYLQDRRPELYRNLVA